MTLGRDPFARLSLNTMTTKACSLREAVAATAAAGLPAIGLWRDKVAEVGLSDAAKLLCDYDLRVSSLCRGGFLTGLHDGSSALDDNRRAIDEAATLGAPALVLVCGGLTGRPLDEARTRVARGIEALVPHALDAGVRLAVEPMHPMFTADRSVVATLGGALALVSPFPPAAAGIALDTYHVWWDERVFPLIAAAGDRIACFQLADWVLPLPADVLLGRGLPGTGCVEFGRFLTAVAAAGYTGPIEVEVFDAALWARPGADVLRDTIAAYESVVASAPA